MPGPEPGIFYLSSDMKSEANHTFDVVIVGAGLSGVGMASHLQEKCPDKSFAILESRSDIGGTWDLFRYPGIRSDSDMYTLGYSFKPWKQAKAIADGPSILSYIRETAEENDVTPHIRFNQTVTAFAWNSDETCWTVTVRHSETGEITTYAANFVAICAGYYRYDKGYKPDFEGEDRFRGEIVHPQFWPEELDYTDKKVVVIGSGATAVTLVPAMAPDADHVTMLQRSPTYIVSRPAEDRIANRLRRFLPASLAYSLTRWKNVRLQDYFYKLARRKPERVKERLIGMVEKSLGDTTDVRTHFTPRYDPWDQRLCLIPDGDLWQALNSGQASVVTDHVKAFDETGIELASGEHVDADIIVTATGLELQFLGGAELKVDGKTIQSGELLNYRGMGYAGVPNLVNVFGYVNASWTLKADLVSEYFCRMIREVDMRGGGAATPLNRDSGLNITDWLDFSSGYVRRARDRAPLQSATPPWNNSQNYRDDRRSLKNDPVDDGYLVFTKPGVAVPQSVVPEKPDHLAMAATSA